MSDSQSTSSSTLVVHSSYSGSALMQCRVNVALEDCEDADLIVIDLSEDGAFTHEASSIRITDADEAVHMLMECYGAALLGAIYSPGDVRTTVVAIYGLERLAPSQLAPIAALLSEQAPSVEIIAATLASPVVFTSLAQRVDTTVIAGEVFQVYRDWVGRSTGLDASVIGDPSSTFLCHHGVWLTVDLESDQLARPARDW